MFSNFTCFRIAQDIFHKLNKNGLCSEASLDQLFCEKDSKFLADRYVEGTCPTCAYPVQPQIAVVFLTHAALRMHVETSAMAVASS